MADAKREPNRHPSPDTTHSIGPQGEVERPSANKLPSQDAGMKGDKNTPDIQRRVAPTAPGEFPSSPQDEQDRQREEEGARADRIRSGEDQAPDLGRADPNLPLGANPSGTAPSTGDLAYQISQDGSMTPIERSRKIDALRMAGRLEEAQRLVPLHQGVTSGVQLPGNMAASERQTDERATRKNVLDHSLPVGLGGSRVSELSGMDKLKRLWEALPDDTPYEHILFGFGGYKVTVFDLGLAVGEIESEEAEPKKSRKK